MLSEGFNILMGSFKRRPEKLTPAFFAIDLFWTNDGVKILEFQLARYSQSAGHALAYGGEYKKLEYMEFGPVFDDHIRPYIRRHLYRDYWDGNQRFMDSAVRDFCIRDNSSMKFLGSADSNYWAYKICYDKAVQALMLTELSDLFPTQQIYPTMDWEMTRTKIGLDFNGFEKVVLKPPQGTMGNNIKIIDTNVVRGLGDEYAFGGSHNFGRTVLVQNKIDPLPIEYEGQIYKAPMRVWMGLVPSKGCLKPVFFADPYYKLTRPLADVSCESQDEVSSIDDFGAAPVDHDVRAAVYKQLSERLPQAFEIVMKRDRLETILELLDSPDDGHWFVAMDLLEDLRAATGHISAKDYDHREELADRYEGAVMSYSLYRNLEDILPSGILKRIRRFFNAAKTQSKALNDYYDWYKDRGFSGGVVELFEKQRSSGYDFSQEQGDIYKGRSRPKGYKMAYNLADHDDILENLAEYSDDAGLLKPQRTLEANSVWSSLRAYIPF